MALHTFIFKVAPEKNGARIDVFLSEALGDCTRSRVRLCIIAGAVRADGETILKCGYHVKSGSTLEIDIRDAEPLKAEAENIPLDIVYQDSDMAVINKPAGMVTHPAPGSESGTLVNALLYNLKDLSGINGVLRPGIVHRLDKNTSGLIMVAKNDNAHLNLSRQIAEKSAKRYYIALVDGNLKEEGGIIEAPLGRNPTDRKKMAVVEGGDAAKTLYKVVERFGKYTLVAFELFTGRTHQIRVHAKYIHHSIVGDSTYGGTDEFGVNRQLLHAYRLSVALPSTGEVKNFYAPLPSDFRTVLKKLRSVTFK